MIKDRNIFLGFFVLLGFLCVSQNNIGFEQSASGQYINATAVSGWTIATALTTTNTGVCINQSLTAWNQAITEFSIISTPLINTPYIGTITHSPLGGQKIAKLQTTSSNGTKTKLLTTVAVTSTNNFLQYAYAGSWDGSSDLCCDMPFFQINIYDCSGNLQSCKSTSFIPSGLSCSGSVTSFSMTGNVNWSNWKIASEDLSAFNGTCVTIEVISSDCAYGNHHGSLYVDFKLSSFPPFNPLTASQFCPGGNLANIIGPLGLSTYTWIAPAGASSISPSQATLQVIQINNPIAGHVYTLTGTYPFSNCLYSQTFTLAHTQVSIVAIGAGTTCATGSSGTATVIASGSASGYIFNWISSTTTVVSTASTVANLSAGNYTVTASVPGLPGCGTATATATVSVGASNLQQTLKLFCGNEAYLQTGPGANYQWYSNTSMISGSVGTAPSLTVTNAIHQASYFVAYDNPNGCRDSILYYLVSVSPATLSILTQSTCLSSKIGEAKVTITPYLSNGNYSYSIFSTGTTPTFSAGLNNTSALNFSVSGLSAGTYSVKIFDNSCWYSKSFTIHPVQIGFAMTPTSAILCSGNSIYSAVTFSTPTPFSQFTYSWSPATFLSPGTHTSPSTIISPTAASGSSSTIVYTVVLTPTALNCPESRTVAITIFNPVTPTLSAIPPICKNDKVMTISAVPGGGTFVNNAAVSSTGQLSPHLAAVGTHTVTYRAPPQGTCVAEAVLNFVVKGVPFLHTDGDKKICSGDTAVVSVYGAHTYTWSDGAVGSIIKLAPSATTSYTVTGTSQLTQCSSTQSLTIEVLDTPSISIIGTFSICYGQAATLTAQGAEEYKWYDDSTDPVKVVSPILTTPYSVIGTNSKFCSRQATAVVEVFALPVLGVDGPFSICAGQPLTLLASGADMFYWSNGTQGHSLTLQPKSTEGFTLLGITKHGCRDSTDFIITAYPTPDLEIIGSSSYCIGEEAKLYLRGADNYFLDKKPISDSIIFLITAPKSFTITAAENAHGCNTTTIKEIEALDCMNSFSNSKFTIVYPNPFIEKITIETFEKSILKLYSELGVLLFTSEIAEGRHELDLHMYSQTIHILEVINSKELKRIKLLKIFD